MTPPDSQVSSGLLVVVPPVSNDGAPVSGATVVGGLPLITRLVRAAQHSGYAEVLVCDAEATTRRLAEAAGAAVVTSSRGAAAPHPRRIVLIPANVVPEPRWLRALLNERIEPERLYVDGASVMLLETRHAGAVMSTAAGCPGAPALAGALSRLFGKDPEPLRRSGHFLLGSATDVARAETWLLQSLIKENEGFMSRRFERRISLAITRRLAPTAITPTAMTLFSLAIGLTGAPFFLSVAPLWQLTGALLFLAHSILDGCDGELARLKFMQSRRGAILDYWGDNLVHVTVFACIAIGWAWSIGSAWPLGLGALAIVGTLGAAELMFDHTAHDRPVTADSPRTARLAAALASRDFIYALILCSAFGKAAWFVVVTAVGAPVFFVVVLWSERRRGLVR